MSGPIGKANEKQNAISVMRINENEKCPTLLARASSQASRSMSASPLRRVSKRFAPKFRVGCLIHIEFRLAATLADALGDSGARRIDSDWLPGPSTVHQLRTVPGRSGLHCIVDFPADRFLFEHLG